MFNNFLLVILIYYIVTALLLPVKIQRQHNNNKGVNNVYNSNLITFIIYFIFLSECYNIFSIVQDINEKTTKNLLQIYILYLP